MTYGHIPRLQLVRSRKKPTLCRNLLFSATEWNGIGRVCARRVAEGETMCRGCLSRVKLRLPPRRA